MEYRYADPRSDLDNQQPEQHPIASARHNPHLATGKAAHQRGAQPDQRQACEGEAGDFEQIQAHGLRVPCEYLRRQQERRQMAGGHCEDAVVERNQTPKVLLVLQKLR